VIITECQRVDKLEPLTIAGVKAFAEDAQRRHVVTTYFENACQFIRQLSFRQFDRGSEIGNAERHECRGRGGGWTGVL
jgi:hypothetical protein